MSAATKAPPMEWLEVRPDNIPQALRQQPRWACWRAVWDPDKGKWLKVPTRSIAKPETWGAFDDAVAEYRRGGVTGIGYLMTGAHGIVGIDLDHCRDAATGRFEPWAIEVIEQANSYSECSPSQTGGRVFVTGAVARDLANHKQGLEIYGGHGGRYLTVTGRRFNKVGDYKPPEQVNAAPAGFLDGLAQRYALAPRTDAAQAEEMPEPVDELALPGLEWLEAEGMSPEPLAFLDSGAVFTLEDRSASIQATAVELQRAGLDKARAFSLLVRNPHVWAIALSKRQGDADRTMAYLWRQVLDAAPKAAARGPLRISADDFDDVSGAAAEFKPALRQPPAWVDAARAWALPENLDAARAPVVFAVDGWIQAGKVGVLVAAGGTGKTTLILTLAVCIATGRAFLGQAVRQGSFLMLSNDDPQEDLTATLAEVCNAMQLTLAEMAQVRAKVRAVSLQGLSGERTFSRADRGDAVPTRLPDYILTVAADMPDLVGIALDTLRQFSGGSSNDEQVIKLTIGGATDIAVRSGAFVVLPHHTGKQNYRDDVTDMYAGSGSAAIADNSRFVLLLQTASWKDVSAKLDTSAEDTGDDVIVLRSTRGSLRVRAPAPIYLRRRGYLLERLPGRIRTAADLLALRDRQILLAVRAGASSKTAIHTAVGGNKRRTLIEVDALIERGLVEEFTGGGSSGGSRPLRLSGHGAAVLDVAEFDAAPVP